ncbi:MAG TPA: PilZ domain-containing protein, partial [Rhodopila sp.]|nr:PilZ domain-containing protein [Rhodopila sp.]
MFDGKTQRPMKPREERVRTVLPARMRSASGWSDACILNVSTGGMLIYSKSGVQPGSHVELRRGGHLVIAHVVWRQNSRIGIRSQAPLPVQEIIDSDTAAAAIAPAIVRDARIERRAQPRDEQRSRAKGRAIEFVSILLFGTAMAGAAAAYVQEVLARPI